MENDTPLRPDGNGYILTPKFQPMRCLVHGVIEVSYVTFHYAGQPDAGPYCMRCLIETIEKLGVNKVTPVETTGEQ